MSLPSRHWTSTAPPATVEAFEPSFRPQLPDVIVGILLASLAAGGCVFAAQLLDPVLWDWDIRDVWFQADLARVISSITDRWGPQYRSNVHPLYALLIAPPTYTLRRLTGMEIIPAVHMMMAIIAGTCLAMLYAVLRLIGCRRLDAVLFSLMAASSAASMFWFVVPETYAFGALTILMPLLVVAISAYRPLSEWWYTTASALSLSSTVTNWMAGIAATVASFHWRRAFQITVNAFALAVLLWGVQKLVFPSVQFFLQFGAEETHFILADVSGGSLEKLRAFLFHSVVIPAIQYVPDRTYPQLQWLLLRVQGASIGSASLWGTVAAVAWALLLALGTWGAMMTTQQRRFRNALAMVLMGQMMLHLLYGEETFLYALHYVPALVLWSSFSTATPARGIALALATVVVIAGGINNTGEFLRTAKFVQQHGPPRHDVQREMRRRADDPWPRGTGHVVVARPGSLEDEKAYHEPGGSFSPAVGSFGISLWITDPTGLLLHTSDDIAVTDMEQQFVHSGRAIVPAIRTRTGSYTVLWTTGGRHQWQLRLSPQLKAGETLHLVLRSVGPAGGPITSLHWNDHALLVNDRWQLSFAPEPVAIELGDEREPGWKTDVHDRRQWAQNDGWGYARLTLRPSAETVVRVADRHGATHRPPPVLEVQPPKLDLNVPDDRFQLSLQAQVAHLLMGIVGRDTRPADPTDFPLAWQRDAAYIIAALARAGQLSAARELATPLAEQDFFGGFGPEADAPGLALWALSEVAALLGDASYDRWLWPHIARKAQWILKMATTEEPLHVPTSGPLWTRLRDNPERTLVAEPSRDGLIMGRVDNHRPILYVNAISFRGLQDAASLADRLGHHREAGTWRAAADRLKQAWSTAVRPPDVFNDRLYATLFWPVRMPEAPRHVTRRVLEQRWTRMRDEKGNFRSWPAWPYYDIAEAHQWLEVGRSDRAWDTVLWFWNHQASPGLYTWWEGLGRPLHEIGDASHRGRFSFHRWRQVRGWTDPPHVTPQYWAAANMLLLQVDMLATVDRTVDPPRITVGAGIPKSWLNERLRVQGLPVPGGFLDWEWDGQDVHVKLTSRHAGRRPPLHILLSPAFPQGTSLQVSARLDSTRGN